MPTSAWASRTISAVQHAHADVGMAPRGGLLRARLFASIATPASVLAVLVAATQGCRIDHIGEAVFVGVLEILEVEAVGGAHVRQCVRRDLLAADVSDRALDLAGDEEEPFGVETLVAGVHACDHEVLADLAVAVDVAGDP